MPNDDSHMSQLLDDSRNRPVVFETSAEPTPRRLRRPVRVLAGATLVFASLAGAAGLAFGGSAVWSVVVPKDASNVPAPLWFPPPPAVSTAPRHVTAIDPDADHSALTGPTATTADRQKGRSPGGSGSSGSGSGNSSSGSGSSGSGRAATAEHTATADDTATVTHEAPATTNQEPEPGHDDNRRGAGGSGGSGGGTSGDDSGGSSGGGGRH